MATPKFVYCKSSRLSEVPKTKGNFIMVVDTKEIYVDYSTSNRVRLAVGDPMNTLGIQAQLNNKSDKSHTHPYAASFSVSGQTVTYTKGDGTTGTFTTQDTKYTLPSATASALGGVKTVTASVVSSIGWDDPTIRDAVHVPTISKLAYWNGAYSDNGLSNLSYCKHGAIGDAAVLSKANVISALSISGRTITYRKADNSTGTINTSSYVDVLSADPTSPATGYMWVTK